MSLSGGSAIPALASAADVAATLGDLNRLLDLAQQAAAKGEWVELAGLEREAQPILEAAVALPGEQARALLPELERAIALLDALETSLKAVGQGKFSPPDTPAKRLQAAAAYRRQDGTS
jgi:hypothetical protein